MAVTPVWATSLLSVIAILLVLLMILAWVAMFGDECGCCSEPGRPPSCCCCRFCASLPCCRRLLHKIYGYSGDEEQIIESGDEENATTDFLKDPDSPPHSFHNAFASCHHFHHPHCHNTCRHCQNTCRDCSTRSACSTPACRNCGTPILHCDFTPQSPGSHVGCHVANHCDVTASRDNVVSLGEDGDDEFSNDEHRLC